MSGTLPWLTAIGSGKGGTGKTFVTLGLAQALARRGHHVLVCDADLGLSNTAVQVGLAHGGDLMGFLAGRTALKDAVVRSADFDLLAAPAGSGALADSDGETAKCLVHLLRRASGYDRVLIDLAAGVGSAVMTLAAHADDVVLLLTPDPAALTDAYAFVKLMLRRTGGRTPAFAVNNATAPEAKHTAEALTHATQAFLDVSLKYLGAIPGDAQVVEAIRRQTPLFGIHPQSTAAQAITALAERLGGPAHHFPATRSLR